ncbi:AAA domain-containing protein [Paenirhodobacter populi]|uniref:AAA domain-containing protein n=1 Tax=Paenirhodobacter populi TaxID=2306993 RepID=UPI000FE327FB|nr:AAA domain-containing protein [Sinirhodobacter populi]RWR04070.1 hypothetical protein D2T32_20805 [Sinirhodobacter populi]
MDPAIAHVVSEAFYNGDLRTQAERVVASIQNPPPFDVIAPLPASPVVIADFKHVSATGAREPVERANPRWHNPDEVDVVVGILRYLRARDVEKPPSLVILTFYNAQVDKLSERIDSAVRSGALAHLQSFRPVIQGGSGVRALGFLRDKRRMNVALSRAKSKLIIVGSVSFLCEAVRGVNPDAGSHDLSFLSIIADTLAALQARPGLTTSRNPASWIRRSSWGPIDVDRDFGFLPLLEGHNRQGPRLERHR